MAAAAALMTAMVDARRDRAQQRQHRERRDADRERPAPSVPVAQRAGDELADTEAHHARRHGGLGERIG
jgi:hypothetical protein